MSPFQAISFLSLHASFPSFLDLSNGSGGKKTVATKRATTYNEYLQKTPPSMRKIHANVINVSYVKK
jgi:hypothetical protein